MATGGDLTCCRGFCCWTMSDNDLTLSTNVENATRTSARSSEGDSQGLFDSWTRSFLSLWRSLTAWYPHPRRIAAPTPLKDSVQCGDIPNQEILESPTFTNNTYVAPRNVSGSLQSTASSCTSLFPHLTHTSPEQTSKLQHRSISSWHLVS